MQKNKFTTYLLYAIGEIVLVVIGILIAVSLNNWNGSHKQKQVEKKYFQNLKNDLLVDMNRLDFMIGYSKTKVLASQKMKLRLSKDSVGSLYDFSTDLLTLIFVFEFKSNQNTYEEMKNSGNFSTIRNDSLKLKLLDLKQAYEDIDGSQEHMRYDFNLFLEDFEEYVDWGRYYDLSKSNIPKVELVYDSSYIENNSKLLEKEAQDLFSSKVFSNNIFLVEINYTYFIDTLEKTKLQIAEIINLLDQELNPELSLEFR